MLLGRKQDSVDDILLDLDRQCNFPCITEFCVSGCYLELDFGRFCESGFVK